MKTEPGMLRRVYDAVALFALLNVLALAGGTAFFSLSGQLDKENVQAAIRALRGDSCAPTFPAMEDVQADAKEDEKKSQRKLFDEVEIDLMQQEAERLKTEVDQRVALANTIMLKVNAEQQTLRREKVELAKKGESERGRQQEAGFQKQLDILTSLNPKMALEHILGMNDVDRAARILATMDSGRAKKIVESARRGEDLARMKQILERMESLPTGAELRAQAGEDP